MSSLAEVVLWGLRQSPSLLVVDVVVQDEFNHDVLMPTGDGDQHYVFETS